MMVDFLYDSWSTTYDDLLSSNQHFPRRISLAVYILLLEQVFIYFNKIFLILPTFRKWWIFWLTSGTRMGSTTEAKRPI